MAGSAPAPLAVLLVVLEVFGCGPMARAQLENVTDNPYRWVDAQLQFRGLKPSYGPHLYALFCLAGLVAVLSLVTLVLQFRQRKTQPGSFWFFRRQYHNQGKIPYIVPHPVNIIVVSSLWTSLLLIVYLGFVVDTWSMGSNGKAIRIASWFPAVWIVFFASVWLSGFGSLYLTVLTPTQYTRRGSLTGLKRQMSPVAVNLLCFTVPIVAICTFLPLQVAQSRQMLESMRAITRMVNTLVLLGNTWETNNGSIDSNVLELLLRQSNDAKEKIKWWTYCWNGLMGTWSFFTLLVMAVAIPFGLQLVLSLHRRIRRMAALQSAQPLHAPTIEFNGPADDAVLSPVAASLKSTKSPGVSPSPSISNLKRDGLPLLDLSVQSLSYERSTSPSSPLATPGIRDNYYQPFFSFSSSASLNSPAQGSLAPSPSSIHHPSRSLDLKHSPSSRTSLTNLRKMSVRAIFPGRSTGLSPDHRAEFEELHKRYWHLTMQYIVIVVVMALICTFAIFEAASYRSVLYDCQRTYIAVMAVSYAYSAAVTVWLCFNLHRLLTSSRSKRHSSPSVYQHGAGMPKLSSYTLKAHSEKAGERSERSHKPETLQLRPPQRGSASSGSSTSASLSPPHTAPLPGMYSGLNIEIDPFTTTIVEPDTLSPTSSLSTPSPQASSSSSSSGKTRSSFSSSTLGSSKSSSSNPNSLHPHSTLRRASTTQFATSRVELVRLHSPTSGERRRSSFRAGSMDLSEALALPSWHMEGRRSMTLDEE